MKTNQKGFSVVEILIVIVVVGLLGAVGWLVYDRQKSKTDSSNQTTQQNQATKESEANTTDPYDGWQTYSATLEPVSFRYPKDWTVATGADAPVNQPDNQFIRLNAPQRAIDGVNYQFSFTFHIHTPTGLGQVSLPVYSSTKLTNTNFYKTLYALTLNGNAPAGSYGAGKSFAVEASATYFAAGSNTDGVNDTIPTSTAGRNIDMGGTYVQVDNNKLAYFEPSQFVSLLEVQQANQIFSSLAQK